MQRVVLTVFFPYIDIQKMIGTVFCINVSILYQAFRIPQYKHIVIYKFLRIKFFIGYYKKKPFCFSLKENKKKVTVTK